MRCNVIAHVWNDELYLPFWLDHHKKLFDHGIIIYYESTDRTREIIADIVPEWKVVSPTQKDFCSIGCDKHIESLEATLANQWKCCLNVTEYMFTDDLKRDLQLFERQYPHMVGFLCSGWGLIDTFEQREQELDPNKPLLLQRQFGFDMLNACPERNGGKRFIHKNICGHYWTGRHGTRKEKEQYVHYYDDIKIVRCFYAPFNTKGMKRKLKIKENMGEYDKFYKIGKQHYMTVEDMERDYQKYLSFSYNLNNNLLYKQRIERISNI